MTPIPPIPEDLRESYAYLKTGTMATKANKLVHYWSDDRICGLIERIAKLRADNKALLEALKDAEHLCKWLLQSGIRPEDRERVIRENGINFAAAIEHSEPQ